MSQQILRPMGIGRILDRSFQLYRTHFVTLAILMLVMYGPMLLLASALIGNSGSQYGSLIEQLQSGGGLESYLESTVETESSDMSAATILFGILGIIGTALLSPVVIGAIVHLVRAQVDGEPIPGPGELLKRSFRRFWQLIGSSLLFGFISMGLYLLIVAVFALVFGILVATALSGGGSGSSAGLIILMIIAIPALVIGISFFVLRWSYFLPYVALGEEGVGIGRSWRVTKGSFWRLLLMYIVLGIILYIITIVLGLITGLFGGGVLSQILYGLVTIVIGSLWILPYAVSFFDLRVRREGYGLDSLLGGNPAYPGMAPPPPPASWNNEGPPDNRP
ncbi:hypothetical protein VE23_22355 [Paenibacillus sp. D9]|uniref:hypothetical protein n=1 Tax=Paenibacillus TaxID=44249 RepID=UPI00061EA04B|nr:MULTISPECIES: hypothetical protein [Paenibacillus]KKC49205.1 hypothetical protein VE23_22355 [Paenibacillus sp. D9]